MLYNNRSSHIKIPKLNLPFKPKIMLQQIVHIIYQITQPIIIVTASNQNIPNLPQNVITIHNNETYQKPLTNLATELTTLQPYMTTTYTSSYNIPFLEPTFMKQIHEHLNDHNLIIPLNTDHHHPLTTIYHTNLTDVIQGLLANKQFRPIALLNQYQTKIIDMNELQSIDPYLQSLQNLNTHKKYKQALINTKLKHHK